jgi:OmcA/MtrC family decaheme c-type cytochrome
MPAQAVGTGRAAIEGHPVIQTGVDSSGLPVFASIPVKGVYKDFAITTTAVRRQIVDFAKCAKCHDGKLHGSQLIPRLSLHGGNRTEEPGLCVMCHNPNQTDGAYRASGQEVSVDFKVMVHSIHAAKFRKTKYIVVGFQGSVNDFSTVNFPSSLKNCALCHIDNGTKGTFELPLVSTLGSTTTTGSVLNLLPGQVDVNPVNDLKTSPIAATCSACHDGPYIHNHMVQMGGQFGVVQSVLVGKEQCATCHGPGRQEDVRKAHGVSGGTSGGSTGGTSRD